MDKRTALLATLGDIEVTDDLIEKVFLEQKPSSIVEGDAYTGSLAQIKELDLISRDIFRELLSQPNIKEGSFSITQDKGALRLRIRQIEKKHGLEGSKQIIGKSVW